MKALLSRFRRQSTIAAEDGSVRYPATLDERIEYMLKTSIPFDADYFQIPTIRNAVEAIARSGFSIRVDNFHNQKVSESIGRLGSAVFSEKYPPFIYLVLGLHPDDIELADTIFHEALHCTAQALDRHIILPENDHTGETWLEELCVYSGLCHLYPKLSIPEMRQVYRRNKERHTTLKQRLATGIPIEDIEEWDRYGVAAANHLYDLIRNYT